MLIWSDGTASRPLAVKLVYLSRIRGVRYKFGLNTMGGAQKSAFKGCDVSSNTAKMLELEFLEKLL